MSKLGKLRRNALALRFCRGVALAGVATAAAVLPFAPAAMAAKTETVPVRFMLMVASQSDGGAYVDPKIGNLPELRKKPLNAFNRFTFVDSASGALEKSMKGNFALRNPSAGQHPPYQLHATLTGVVGERRYSFLVELPGANKVEVTLNAGESLFVGGQKLPDGTTLVFGFTPNP